MQQALTAVQYKVLQAYEHHFATARVGYIRGVMKAEIDAIKPIHDEIFGTYKNSHVVCNACVMRMFAELARLYDAYVPVEPQPVKMVTPKKVTKKK